MRTTDLPDTINIAFNEIQLPDSERQEPLSASTVAAAEFAEARRLDPTRIDLDPELKPPKGGAWRGSIASLLLHLLPLLALIAALRPPLEIPPPIPIQLVIEPAPPPSPPPPPKQATPHKTPPPGLRASDDFGEVGPPNRQNGEDHASTPQDEPQPPIGQATEAAAQPEPPAEPTPPPRLVAPPPAPPVDPAPQAPIAAPAPAPPAESTQIAAALPPPLPKPVPLKPKALPPLLEQQGLVLPLPLHPDRRREGTASARYPGPDASRDEYCAYALKLTLAHIDLLPPSLLGARRGDTVVTIRLNRDGTVIIARVVQGSGYEDIDERVAQMVWAVKRFPPLPLWLPGPTADFTFRLHFPHTAQP